MNFFQSQAMIGKVHETHHGSSKVELLRGKRQFQSACHRISNGVLFFPFHLGRKSDEGRCDIDCEHLRAPSSKQTRVMAFSATYIQAFLSRHVRKQVEESGRIDCVAIDIPALA
jgi:hypothetical protein